MLSSVRLAMSLNRNRREWENVVVFVGSFTSGTQNSMQISTARAVRCWPSSKPNQEYSGSTRIFQPGL